MDDIYAKNKHWEQDMPFRPFILISEDYDDEVLDIKILIRLLRSLQVFVSPRNSKV